MLLSRLTLREGATHRTAFWAMTRDPHTLHKAVWNLFADHPDRRRDFLYRLDSERGRPVLWTLSERPPRDPEAIWRGESRRLEPVLHAGDRVELAARVNPTICRAGKRHDVVMDAKRRIGWGEMTPAERPSQGAVVQEALEEWTSRRGAVHGFRLRRLCAEGYRVMRFEKPSGRPVQLGVVDLLATVEVIEPRQFLDLWRRGLGPAKGFGCGLVLLRRSNR